MNRFVLIISRVLMVTFAVLSLVNTNPVGKVLFLGLALIVGVGGHAFYKRIRSKTEEAEDVAVENESKRKILSGIDTVANLKPAIEIQVANKLQSILSKADAVSPADKIRELDLLRTEGVITEEEFSKAKKSILGV